MMKNIKKILRLIFTTCIILVLSACGGSDKNKSTDKILTSLSVTPSSVSIILGQTQALTATATYDNNSTANVNSSVTWNSSDNAIALVNTNGFITSVAVGNATITASLTGINASSDINVKANTLKSLTVEPADASIKIEQTLNLIAKATYADNSTDNVTSNVTWVSSDDTVATVANGVVTGVSSGDTTITANLSGTEASSDITVSDLIYNLQLFISADDGLVGQELFVTDGTSEGTSLVKDINTNINTNTSSDPDKLTVVNGVNYFVANDGFSGFELWKTDGTSSGTVMVKDINPGFDSSNPTYLTALGNTLYFIANTELWKSDGTTDGTVMVKDIYAGAISGMPEYLTVIGNTLYFSADDEANGRELWKSDGTPAGSVMVKDIYPLQTSSFVYSSYPSSLTTVGSTLYFRAEDGINGDELWKSDGTTTGTVMVKDIYPGQQNTIGFANSGYPSGLTAVGNTLYFAADDGLNGNELWKSDGTDTGTTLVKDFNIQPGSSGNPVVLVSE